MDPMPEDAAEQAVADAAVASSTEAADAIARAAEENDDPEVAAHLEDAATAADKTVARVGWLRGLIHRLFGSPRS